MNSNFKLPVILIAIVLIFSTVFISCNENAAGSSKNSNDTVTVEIIKQSDTSSFVKGNGSKCRIVAETTIAVPKQYKDAQTTAALCKLFKQVILDAGDSLQVNDAIHQYLSNTLHQYDFADAPEPDEIELDNTTETVETYTNSTTISVYYNKNSIITFCKVEVVKKDDKVTSLTHKYFSFDLEKMSFVIPNMLFKDDAQTGLCNELRNQFLRDNKVSSNDQLNELGFFNIDNMTVTRNFYFGENGVTWSYLPNELAVEALGEPTVTLDYEALEPFLCENSIIERLR